MQFKMLTYTNKVIIQEEINSLILSSLDTVRLFLSQLRSMSRMSGN